MRNRFTSCRQSFSLLTHMAASMLLKLQVLLLLTVNIRPSSAAITAVAPTAAQVTLGRSISLFCYGEAGDQLYWIDGNGIVIRQGDRAGVDVVSYSRASMFALKMLTFTNVQAEHEGVYCCSLVPQSCSEGLNVTFDVVFLSQDFNVPQIQYVQPDSNGDVFIGCGLNPGDPKPGIVWYLLGKGFLNLTDSSKYSANYSGLLIHQFSNEDTGSYTCEYQHHLSGSFSSNTQVRLIGAVLITGPKQLRLGSDASLHCIYDSRLSISRVQWILPNGTAQTGSMLNIVNVRIDQEGRYQCEIHIHLSNGSDEVMIDDHKISVFDPPVPAELRDQVTIFSGTTVELRLILKNEPIPPLTQYRWMKNEEALISSSKYTIDDGTGVLTIQTVAEDDAGTYTCVGGNEFGQSIQTYDVSWIAGGTVTGDHTDLEVITLNFRFMFKAAHGTSQLSCQELKLSNASLQNTLGEHLVNNICHCRVVVVVETIDCSNDIEGEVTLRLAGPGASNVADHLKANNIVLLNASLMLVPRTVGPINKSRVRSGSIDADIIVAVCTTIGVLVAVVVFIGLMLTAVGIVHRLVKRSKGSESYEVEEADNSTMKTDSGTLKTATVDHSSKHEHSDELITTLSESPKLLSNPAYVSFGTEC